MGDLNHEPSMEEILASIKRIIAEDGEGAPVAPRRNVRRPGIAAAEPSQPADHTGDEGVLELTERVDVPVAAEAPVDSIAPVPQPTQEEEPVASAVEDEARDPPPPPLVSQPAERASRDAIAALSALVVKPEAPGADSLEGLVREMLRPMLKDWLDARLPEVVEQIVQREIARIVGDR